MPAAVDATSGNQSCVNARPHGSTMQPTKRDNRTEDTTAMNNNNKSMEATEEELKWAARIKEAAEADEDIDATALSDLEFLQHALVAKDKVPKALTRIKHMQKFKQMYGIQRNGSYQDAMRDLKAFNEAHPNFILAIGGLDEAAAPAGSKQEQYAHTHVLSCDYAQFLAKKMHSEEAFKVFLRGLFYCMQACQPNIAAMRAGFCFLANAANIGWRNFSVQAEERCAALYADAYPIRVKQMAMMNASPILRVFYNICKVFLSKKIRQTVVFCAGHDAFLNQCDYAAPILLPTQWGGTMDVDIMQKMLEMKIKQRYKLEESFKL